MFFEKVFVTPTLGSETCSLWQRIESFAGRRTGSKVWQPTSDEQGSGRNAAAVRQAQRDKSRESRSCMGGGNLARATGCWGHFGLVLASSRQACTVCNGIHGSPRAQMESAPSSSRVHYPLSSRAAQQTRAAEDQYLLSMLNPVVAPVTQSGCHAHLSRRPTAGTRTDLGRQGQASSGRGLPCEPEPEPEPGPEPG